MDLEELIKTLNLVYTDTIKSKDFCRVDFDINKTEVNYDNSISFYDLIYAFNKLYNSFKKKYDALEKFDFCQEQYPVWFSEFDIDQHYRVLELFVDGCDLKRFLYENLELNLREIDGKNESYITNGIEYLSSPDYYYEDLNLDDNIVKKYLDLFQEYDLLMKLFQRLYNEMIFGNGTYTIFTEIKSEKKYFGDKLNTIKLFFGAGYFNANYNITIVLKLGDTIEFDLDNCKIDLDDEIIPATNEVCSKILKSIFINGKYLVDNREKEREQIGDESIKMLKKTK